jgi:hypothetical protein
MLLYAVINITVIFFDFSTGAFDADTESCQEDDYDQGS